MRRRPKISPALKHGGYSGLTLLPGEDRFAFEKLRRELFDELKPQGRLEQEIVTDIARLIPFPQRIESEGAGLPEERRLKAVFRAGSM